MTRITPAVARTWQAALLSLAAMLIVGTACGSGSAPAAPNPTPTSDAPAGAECTAGEVDCDSGEFGSTPGAGDSILDATPPALFPTATPGGDAEPGAQVPPDFTLPQAGGGDVTLSELLEAGPVVVVFYRTFF